MREYTRYYRDKEPDRILKVVDGNRCFRWTEYGWNYIGAGAWVINASAHYWYPISQKEAFIEIL